MRLEPIAILIVVLMSPVQVTNAKLEDAIATTIHWSRKDCRCDLSLILLNSQKHQNF